LKHAAWRQIERLASSISDLFDEPQTELLAERSRFYFHVENGSRYPDETGSAFSTPEDATAHAVIIARELAQGRQLAWILHSRYGRPGTQIVRGE